jgi:hypothetical protein
LARRDGKKCKARICVVGVGGWAPPTYMLVPPVSVHSSRV